MLFGESPLKAPPEDLLVIFNGLENIEELLLPQAKESVAGRVAETTLVWNILGSHAATPEVSEALRKEWLIQGRVNPRQWGLYASGQPQVVDLTLVNSCYSYVKYLINGKQSPIWTIPLGSYHYIPSLATYKAPYGVEHGISSLLKGPERLYSFYIKKGEASYGGGFNSASLMKFKEIDFGFMGDVWHQRDRWGGRLGLELTLNFFEDGHLQAEAGSGFKTAGYLPGYDNSSQGYIESSIKWKY